MSKQEIKEFTKVMRGDTPKDANQFVPKKYVDKRLYAGTINADGSKGTPFPSGWSISKIGTGDYIVTHNLGVSSFVLMVSSPAFTVVQGYKSTTVFEVLAYTALGAGSNQPVDFIVTTY